MGDLGVPDSGRQETRLLIMYSLLVDQVELQGEFPSPLRPCHAGMTKEYHSWSRLFKEKATGHAWHSGVVRFLVSSLAQMKTTPYFLVDPRL
jgi:hypothetical protein